MNKNKCYITTPIYYVNAKPHLGTLYSTVLADILARWHKLLGKKVFFLTGTDEHGQKIQERAQALNMTPQALCDSTVPEFQKTWQRYEIGYDKFIRTTDPEHVKAVQAWVTKMQELGDIYKSHYTGLYCVPCETFINNTTELVYDQDKNPCCPSCKRPVKEMAEESYFFRLSAYEDQLLKFYEEHPDFITPRERLNEVIAFVKSGLKDLSISRKTVSWGIPFPGDPSHTVYVWGDALNNYLSAIGGWSEQTADKEHCNFWWPADIHLMAKDIVRFHAVYWPAFLMAAQLPLPKKLLVHGYILMGDQKMSKSLGNAIDPETLADRYGVEQIRYYLARQLPVNQDGQFSIKDVEERIGADLANNLGNLLNRTTSLALANGLTTVVAPQALEKSSSAIKEKAEEMFRIFSEEMDKSLLHIALAELWKFISEVNAYFHAQQPWVLAKTNKELFAEVIHTTCQSLQAIGIVAWPFMPTKMEQLLSSIGQTFTLGNAYEAQLRKNQWNSTFTLTKLDEPLFIRPEPQAETEPAQPQEPKEAQPTMDTISIDEFSKMHLITGTILACEPVAGSNKLLKLSVDCGSYGQRTILSGVAGSFKPEDLINKQGVFVANLPPRKMMGMESQGMMLLAEADNNTLRRVTIEGPVPNGTRLR